MKNKKRKESEGLCRMSVKCKCNTILEEGEFFCHKCGTRVADLAPQEDSNDVNKVDRQDDAPAAKSRNEVFMSRQSSLKDLEYEGAPSGVTVRLDGADVDVLNQNSSLGSERTTELKREVLTSVPELKPIPALAQSDFSSDCSHFQVEWNQGCSIFLSQYTTAFQFRITPLNEEARRASKIMLYLKLPLTNEFTQCTLRPLVNLTRSRIVDHNYTPGISNQGPNQSVGFHFSYHIDDVEYCYDSTFYIDIYPQNERSDKILENLTIKIGDISQAGDVSDHTLGLFNGFNLNNVQRSTAELFNELKKAELWKKFELYQGYSLTPPKNTRTTMRRAAAPVKRRKKIILECKNGTTIHLFGSDVVAGRSKSCDITLRHDPGSMPHFDLDQLRSMNLKISSRHCQMGIDRAGAWISDPGSTNGTYLNEQRIFSPKRYLKEQKEYLLSLAAAKSNGFNLVVFLRVYLLPEQYAKDSNQTQGTTAGMVVKRKDHEADTYMLVNRLLPLASAAPDSGNFFISYKDNNFALTDNNKIWIWLEPNVSLPEECGLVRVVDVEN